MSVIQKRHVIMVSGQYRMDDYVPVDVLSKYVADAETRWEHVIVPAPDEHDPGPAGDDGPTADLSHLDSIEVSA